MRKRGQAGTEYLIVVGFVTFAVLSIIAIAFSFSNQTEDRIKLNQAESFATQLIDAAETVFYAGEPSMAPATLYLPSGVTNITLNDQGIIMKINVYGGAENVRAYTSNVPLNGTLPLTEGSKKIMLQARSSYVYVSVS